MSGDSYKVLDKFEKTIKRKEKGFKELEGTINNLHKEFVYGSELKKIIEDQEVAGIGYLKQERVMAPRRGFNRLQKLSYFLTSNLAEEENKIKIIYDSILEAKIKQHEDYKYVVKGRLGLLGIGKEASYEQIIKNKEIILKQEKLSEPRPLTTYAQPQSKIYLLRKEDLQKIQEILK